MRIHGSVSVDHSVTFSTVDNQFKDGLVFDILFKLNVLCAKIGRLRAKCAPKWRAKCSAKMCAERVANSPRFSLIDEVSIQMQLKIF